MATIGHKAAVADAFGRKVTGVPAYLMWGLVHVAYLVGWGNRIGAMYTWGRALYFSKNRPHRIITFEQANMEVEGLMVSARPAPILPRQQRTREEALPGPARATENPVAPNQ